MTRLPRRAVMPGVDRFENPFAEVTLDDHVVTATSTAGRIWSFPRNALHRVRTTPDPAYPWPR
ncbi:hypothetical protein GCM10010430_10560 [Kitasatospora cystarginea]|uniref:Uncharacterized protein n=1 Tax=Kitasatospora cystarginea TaxID=58350 RepID=A0ABP5QD42_9ACTN